MSDAADREAERIRIEMNKRPSDSYFVVYAVWWLLPLGLTLFSMGRSDTTTRFIQCLTAVWLLGAIGFALRPFAGFVISSIAVLAAWLPAFVQLIRRMLYMLDGKPVDENWSPVLFTFNMIIEITIWLVPTTYLLVELLRFGNRRFLLRGN
ncbi:MAG: hypothetical protein KDB27_20580 [Planctomycetales bacterium]|nr:hypothetical protein [Planctomycetales bacterium]